MPFDRKLVQQAEAPLTDAGDLQLPDDLLELAAQLGDDAQHLATVYPVQCTHLAPRDDSPLAEREEYTQSIGLLSAVPEIKWRGGDRETGRGGEGDVTHLRFTSGRLMRAVALVASLAAIAVGVAVSYPRDNADEPMPRNIAEALPSSETAATDNTDTTLAPVVAANPLSPFSNPQSAISNQQSPPPASPQPASRETFLHEYSGPELEGLYDLIGDAEEDTISI